MSPMVAEQVDVVVHTDVLKKADLDGWCVAVFTYLACLFLCLRHSFIHFCAGEIFRDCARVCVLLGVQRRVHGC